MRAAHSSPKDGGDEEGQIEGGPSPNNVGNSSPERCSHAETGKDRQSGEPDVSLADPELIAQGRKRDCNALKPEVVGQPTESLYESVEKALHGN